MLVPPPAMVPTPIAAPGRRYAQRKMPRRTLYCGVLV